MDGVEATRQAQTWRSHLETDIAHVADPKYRNLSGYVFVGGYPGEAPTAEIDEWVDRFVAAGLDRTKVTILVGADLVAELCRSEYASVRQVHLGLAAAPEWFRLLGHVPINDRRLGLFQPPQEEYDRPADRQHLRECFLFERDLLSPLRSCSSSSHRATRPSTLWAALQTAFCCNCAIIAAL